MTRVLWEVRGARLHMPRDLHIAYACGRMAIATAAHIAPLFYGSPTTARVGCARLLKLGLLRTFPRDDLTKPAWYSLASAAVEWVAEQMECEPAELRTVSGIQRVNKAAVDLRNSLWSSSVTAARATGGRVGLVRARPEWELRRMSVGVPVVPDLQLVFADRAAQPEPQHVWLLELDATSERTAVIAAKASAYVALRDGGSLYGAESWRVLFVTPTLRRARTVAAAVAGAGAGAFTYVAVGSDLLEGCALSFVLFRAADLANSTAARPSSSLVGDAVGGAEGRSATPISG